MLQNPLFLYFQPSVDLVYFSGTKPVGEGALAVLSCIEIFVYLNKNFRYLLAKYSQGTHVAMTSG